MRTATRNAAVLTVSALLVLVPAGAILHGTVTQAAGSRAAAASASPVKAVSGQVLVNAQGMTIYVFSSDKPNKSNCTGECAKFWPAVTVSKGAKVPAAMTGISGKFGFTMHTGGVEQLTFDGAPLYTFANDKKPGDMHGQGLFGLWWAVVTGVSGGSPSGTSTPTSGGRYGY